MAVPPSVCALADRLQIFRLAEDSLKQLGLGAKDLGNRRGQGPPEKWVNVFPGSKASINSEPRIGSIKGLWERNDLGAYFLGYTQIVAYVAIKVLLSSSPEDKAATKVARSIFSRRGIDISQTDFRVQNGICYLRGTVKYLASGSHISLQQELVEVQKALRQKPGIRDVSFEVVFR